MISYIIKASASWCGPCRQLAKELANFDLVPITEIDIDDNEDFCKDANIKSVPTLLYMDKDNVCVYRSSGFVTKSEVESKVKELNENN